jgi:hypothetical protein
MNKRIYNTSMRADQWVSHIIFPSGHQHTYVIKLPAAYLLWPPTWEHAITDIWSFNPRGWISSLSLSMSTGPQTPHLTSWLPRAHTKIYEPATTSCTPPPYDLQPGHHNIIEKAINIWFLQTPFNQTTHHSQYKDIKLKNCWNIKSKS